MEECQSNVGVEALRSKPVGNTPPWSLQQLMPPGFYPVWVPCPDFLEFKTEIWKHKPNKSFPPDFSLVVLITAIDTQRQHFIILWLLLYLLYILLLCCFFWLFSLFVFSVSTFSFLTLGLAEENHGYCNESSVEIC